MKYTSSRKGVGFTGLVFISLGFIANACSSNEERQGVTLEDYSGGEIISAQADVQDQLGRQQNPDASENKYVDIARKITRDYGLTSIPLFCLDFELIKESFEGSPVVDVREIHSDVCQGDKNTAPRLFSVAIDESAGVVWSDARSVLGQMEALGKLMVQVNPAYISELSLESITRQRSRIEFSSGQTASNCTAYLENLVISAISEGVNNQVVKTEYLMCEVYELTKTALRSELQTNGNFGNLLSLKLDLSTFPSSLNRRARSNTSTLREIAGVNLTTDDNSATYETDEWVYHFELIAISDFDHDGVDDWIVILEDKSKIGNYHAATTLVVKNPEASMRFSATPFSSYVKDRH